MNDIKNWILKKRSIWFHILVGYFSAGLWWIIFGIFYFLNKSGKFDNHTQVVNKPKEAIYDKSFNVAGISFHNKELKQIIKNGLDTENIEKFEGMTREEKVEYCQYGEGISEYSEQQLEVSLRKTLFEGKPAIEVLADDFYGNDVLIGYIPKKEIDELIDLLDKKVLVWATIVGGKVYYFGETKEEDEYEELELGVNLIIKIYEQ